MRDFRRAPRGGHVASMRTIAPMLAGLVLVPACGLNQQGVPPPRDRIAYPASAYVDGNWLYVVNSNSDLRYNNGTLVAVDLDKVAADRPKDGRTSSWALCPQVDYVRPASGDSPVCCWDRLDHNILNCDERPYIPAASTIEVGSFGAGMVFQSFKEEGCPTPPDPSHSFEKTQAANAKIRHDCAVNCAADPKAGRLFIGVRGNSSITYVDTTRVKDAAGGERPVFSPCSSPAGDTEACAVTHTTSMPGGTPALLPDEPYALALDPAKDLLYVGHLKGDIAHVATGGISLFDVSGASFNVPPTFIGPSGSFFSADGNGFFGITSLTLARNQIYASSRYLPTVTSVIPTTSGISPEICGTPQFLLGSGDTFSSPLVGAEVRGIQFLPEGNRAFILQRVPPALVGFDISGLGNFPSDVLETCASPTFLQQYDGGEGARLFVTCFESGQVYVFDPYVPRLISVMEVGRGPAGLVFAPVPPGSNERRAYVVGFSASNISVVDLTPGSTTQYHVIQRIGFPSPVPR
jgi:hypothetical protein